MSDEKPYAGMSLERWDTLMNGTGPCVHLTPGEMAAGWHYCNNGWDGLLISPIDLEYKFCRCPEQQHHKREASYYERLQDTTDWVKEEPRHYPEDFKENFGEVS
jgi:hypothetical protein